jgi:Fe(3+) dicitrate transport protein
MKSITRHFKQYGATPGITRTKLALAMAIALSFPTLGMAAEIELPRIDVVGEGEDAIAKQPGSVAIITQEELELMQPLSTQDALKSVPGIVVREEEGYGFIPNIGMRGLNPNRSQKLLVLEDGVPVAPGLFLANESYYSPRI